MTSSVQWVLDLAAWSFTAFAAGLFIIQSIAREVGYALGRRHRAVSNAEPEGVGVLVGSMLALLAFVLALTLSFATDRYDERQAGTLAEANAIGTAWLRATAIDGPSARQIADRLVEYTKLRAEFVRAPAHAPTLDALTKRTGELQTEIWGHATALARQRPDPIVALLMSSLNETFDASTAERFALEKKLPVPVFWLLIGLALVSMGAVGYQLGIRKTPLRLLSVLLTAMWTLVMIDILDLAAPRMGDIRQSVEVYQWTLDGFGASLPPRPTP